MKTKIGPTTECIPAQKIMTCHDCRCCEKRMVRSGLNPIVRLDCNHADAPPKPMKLSYKGNLPKDGRTPSWCPFIT